MKILTSGFFDQLNPSQLNFLEGLAEIGELYVGVGSDDNHFRLKGTWPLFRQMDRVCMIEALKCVKSVSPLNGDGDADFAAAIRAFEPDCYFASKFNHSEEKKRLCERIGIEYRIFNTPTPPQTTESSNESYFPYRICMTGGWLDQPWVSEVCHGSVTVLGIEPDREFMFRGGMATSTRETAKRIWSTFPSGDPINIAKILFGAENPPGTKYISGSQDALGLCLPGFSTLHYEGSYWPSKVESLVDTETAEWLQETVWLLPLRERTDGYDPLLEKNLTEQNVSVLARSSKLATDAVRTKNGPLLGDALKMTLAGWRKILPLTVPEEFQPIFDEHDKFHGYNMSGCGGGYLIVISEQAVPNAFQIKVRF